MSRQISGFTVPRVLRAMADLHRSGSIGALQDSFLESAAVLIETDAAGFYLLDEKAAPVARFASGVPDGFLADYEWHRRTDPIFQYLLETKQVAEGVALLGSGDWNGDPLCRFLKHWGLKYSLQGPIVVRDRVIGTLNFARSASRSSFGETSTQVLRVLCDEFSVVLQRMRRERMYVADLDTLPPRLRQVAGLVVQGLSNKAISRELGISPNTVKDHLKRLYRYFGASNRTQLAWRLMTPGGWLQ